MDNFLVGGSGNKTTKNKDKKGGYFTNSRNE